MLARASRSTPAFAFTYRIWKWRLLLPGASEPRLKLLRPQDFRSVFQTALRGQGNRSIVVVGNYECGPISAVPCRAKARPLRPRRSYFAPAETCTRRALVEAPGTAPGSDGFIATAIYRHSRVAPAHRNISAEGYRRKSACGSQKLGLTAGAGSFRRRARGTPLPVRGKITTLPNPGPASHACKRKAEGSILKTSGERGSNSRVTACSPAGQILAEMPRAQFAPNDEHVLPRPAAHTGVSQELRQARRSFGAARGLFTQSPCRPEDDARRGAQIVRSTRRVFRQVNSASARRVRRVPRRQQLNRSGKYRVCRCD